MTPHDLKTCNLNYLFELAKGDMAFVREMIEVFLEESEGEMDNLSRAIDGKDFEQIRQVAHKLRSSIPYVGLDILIGDAVAEIEDLGKDGGSIDEVKNLFKKVKSVSAEAVKELKTLQVCFIFIIPL
jgi:HPt (histidine-containing phosphotransfer) domain-containing protein